MAKKNRNPTAEAPNQAQPPAFETVLIRLDDGEQIELTLSLDEILRRTCGKYFTLPDGRIGVRLIQFTAVRTKGEKRSKIADYSKIQGISIGVHPKQARSFTEAAHRDGNLGVRYCEQTGRLIASSYQARKREAARRGFVDYNAGYGHV